MPRTRDQQEKESGEMTIIQQDIIDTTDFPQHDTYLEAGMCPECERPLDLLDPLKQLDKDTKRAARELKQSQVRFLVDYYYQMQRNRIRSKLQADRATDSNKEGEEPGLVLDWVMGNSRKLETNIRTVLNTYTDGNDVGRWAKSIVGIGPVIAAGLLAHIDIEKAPTVGHIWRFAGLDPTLPQRQQKGVKSPHNVRLKTLCWKIGESFVKVHNKEADVYGHIYMQRKEMEAAANEAGQYAEQAANKLATTNIGKATEAYGYYSQGKLPPAHLHARAKRYAVKLFLSNLHCVWYFLRYNQLPPRPWIVEFGGHVDIIWPPNADLVPGMEEAIAGLLSK